MNRGERRLRNVWLLALGIFATNTGSYALGFSCDGQESFRRLRSRHRCLQRTLLRLRHGRRVSGQPPTAAASQDGSGGQVATLRSRQRDSKIVASWTWQVRHRLALLLALAFWARRQSPHGSAAACPSGHPMLANLAGSLTITSMAAAVAPSHFLLFLAACYFWAACNKLRQVKRSGVPTPRLNATAEISSTAVIPTGPSPTRRENPETSTGGGQ